MSVLNYWAEIKKIPEIAASRKKQAAEIRAVRKYSPVMARFLNKKLREAEKKIADELAKKLWS